MKKVPNLRFKEFKGEWEQHVLGDIFEFYTTNSFSRDFLDNDNGSVKNIHYGDIHMKFPTLLNIKNTQIPYVKESVDLSKISLDSYCKNGDVVIADASEDYNDIGKAIELKSIGEEKIIAGLHTILARDNKGIMVNGFRGYLMTSPNVRKQIKVYAAGAKVLGISKANISKVKLLIPSGMEQEKIAAFFYLIDKKIGLQTEKVEELKNYKKGLLQKIFSQELRFKDENGNEYPEWEEYKVKDLFDVTRGVVIAKSEISDTSNDIFKYAVYSSQTSNNGILGYDQTFDFDGNYLTWTTDGANAGRVFCRSGRFRCTNVCGVLVEKNNTIGYANKLVAEILNKETPKHVSYVGNPKLMNGVMAEIKLNIPSLEEQTKIDKLINQLDIKIESEQTKLNLLDDYKKGLLQQMFI